MLRILSTALLYVALGLGANAYAGDLADDLNGLREGSMRKLVVHSEPRAAQEVMFYRKDGSEEALAATDGKVRVVNFWATWCAPCRAEKPALDALQAEMGGADFEVVALATGRNSPANIARFNDEVGIAHLATRLDPKSAAARAMAVLGLPVSVILDREGREIARLQGGADWDSASAKAIIQRLIADGS
ncbi:MAG: TlpA disulfide reductase family protein [Pseudomonadota bacterium]